MPLKDTSAWAISMTQPSSARVLDEDHAVLPNTLVADYSLPRLSPPFRAVQTLSCIENILTCLQAQKAALRRVGQGGLDEAAGEGPSVPDEESAPGQARGRHAETVAGTDLQRVPCQADDAIRVLTQQLRARGNSRASKLTPEQGTPSQTGCFCVPASCRTRLIYSSSDCKKNILLLSRSCRVAMNLCLVV